MLQRHVGLALFSPCICSVHFFIKLLYLALRSHAFFAIILGGELFINHICLWQEQPPPNFGDVCALSLKWWNLCADWINKVLIYRVGVGTFWLMMLFILFCHNPLTHGQTPEWLLLFIVLNCCSNEANNQPYRGKRGGPALS